MRMVAVQALEQWVKGAKQDEIYLAGVSAYRSYATQSAIFNHFEKRDGIEKARTYSAHPGSSEHETGLAIDVSGIDGKCAALDCFAARKEAIWLDQHAHKYGYIIRYPKGKEAITGYQYEPWHIRFVGTDNSKEMALKEITLEDYFLHLSSGSIPQCVKERTYITFGGNIIDQQKTSYRAIFHSLHCNRVNKLYRRRKSRFGIGTD